MQDMSVFWLRAAVALYAVGLFHTFQTVLRKGASIFRPALIAFGAGAILHMVSLVEAGRAARHFPPEGLHNSVSICAFLIAVLFLIVYRWYSFERLAVFVFPLVFFMAGAASTYTPIQSWDSSETRSVWLVVHILLVLLGCAALVLTVLASVFYLVQERQLKRKKPIGLLERLPPLGTLDALISKSLGLGFILLTVGLVTGITWAYIDTGPEWIRDPRVSVAILNWAVCLLMVLLRVTAGWRGRKAAVLAVAVLAFSVATWATHYVTH
jgi:ABC-type uncharacterized transport system permease subunit